MRPPTRRFCSALISLFLLASCTQSTRFDAPHPGCLADQLDLNLATENELVSLPGVGEKTAREIVEFRSANGGFRRTEQLLIIRGMSKKRFVDLGPLVCVR